MTAAYVDSSSVVSLAFAEPGHEALIATLARVDRLYSSNILEAEVRTALAREGVAEDPRLFERLSWVLPERPLSTEIGRVLAAGHLRGADLWHVACALYLAPDPGELVFVTEDQRQAAVAKTLGFAGAA